MRRQITKLVKYLMLVNTQKFQITLLNNQIIMSGYFFFSRYRITDSELVINTYLILL